MKTARQSQGTCRVLGVDTSLRRTGTALVEARGHSLAAIHYGSIGSPRDEPKSAALLRLARGIAELVASHRPDAAAIEGVFYSKNLKTAVALGEARGVVIAACVEAGVPVFEYAPRRVKQAVVGFGAAPKDQVRRMVMSILGLADKPDEDAGDALALAVCHLHNRTCHAALAPRTI